MRLGKYLIAADATMTLTKADLSEQLVDGLGLNRREAREMVEAFFEEISAGLEDGEGVKLSGFGHFALRDKPARPGRNPKTGVEIPNSARRVVTFHANIKLKLAVDVGVSRPNAECRKTGLA